MREDKHMKSIYGVTLSLLAVSGLAIAADDNADLDDIRDWPMVKMETCLDAALDTIPGHARKLELKMEGDDPIYEFDIESKKDGSLVSDADYASQKVIASVLAPLSIPILTNSQTPSSKLAKGSSGNNPCSK